MKIIIGLLIVLFSPYVFASYPASTAYYKTVTDAGFTGYGATQAAACTDTQTKYRAANPTYTWMTASSSGSNCNWYNNGTYWKYYNIGSTNEKYCPYTGTLSGTTCINESACPSGQTRRSTDGLCGSWDVVCTLPQLRNATTNTCYTPVACNAPEIDNGFGICAVQECTGGKILNQTTGACQTAPTCGSTETYVNATNTCQLYPLACPLHSHASTANDKCLADPPMVCPTGQHDDGTYQCVANDAVACSNNQTYGTINGIPQCITKPNNESINKASDDAAAAAAAAKTAQTNAQVAKNNADAALAADPTNQTKIDAAAAAATALNNANTALSTADAAALKAQDLAIQKALEAIEQTLKEQQDKEKGKAASSNGIMCTSPPSCTGDPIQCLLVSQNFQAICHDPAPTQAQVDEAMGGTTTLTENTQNLASLNSSGYVVGSTCPAPHLYTVMGKSLSIDYSPFCSLAVIFGNLMVITASFVSLRILST